MSLYDYVSDVLTHAKISGYVWENTHARANTHTRA